MKVRIYVDGENCPFYGEKYVWDRIPTDVKARMLDDVVFSIAQLGKKATTSTKKLCVEVEKVVGDD